MTIPALTTRTVATVHPAIPHLHVCTHRSHQQWLFLSGLGLSSFIITGHHSSDPRLAHVGKKSSRVWLCSLLEGSFLSLSCPSTQLLAIRIARKHKDDVKIQASNRTTGLCCVPIFLLCVCFHCVDCIAAIHFCYTDTNTRAIWGNWIPLIQTLSITKQAHFYL